MQVIAKEIQMFWKLRSRRKRDNMKVNDIWILPNLRMEVRKVMLFSFNSSKKKAHFISYFTLLYGHTTCTLKTTRQPISLVCHNDIVSHSWGWVSHVGISAVEWWKLIFHVLLKCRGDTLVC